MKYNTIIDGQTLSDHSSDDGWRLFDCRFSLSDPAAGQRGYDKGHIPGATFADLEKHLSAEKTSMSGRHPLPQMKDFVHTIEEWGVRPDSQVVVYDDAGGVFAGRLWWMLRWIGHKNVAVLDGGLPAWERYGFPLTCETGNVDSQKPGSYPVRPLDEIFLSTADIENNLHSKEYTLFDARGAERFTGAKEPVDPIGGHIPRAINLPFSANLDDVGGFLPASILRERFEPLLATLAPDNVVHMCGSGVSACHNILAMSIAGFNTPRLYVGSWSEWVSDASRPVARGND